GKRRKPREGFAIVGDAVGRILVGADIDADDALARACRQPFGRRRHALVVEAESVDDGAILPQPEHPGPRIAGLGTGGDGAAFDETEAQLEHEVGDFGILVEAGGEPQGVWKKTSEQGDSESWVIRWGGRQRPAPGFEEADCGAVG